MQRLETASFAVGTVVGLLVLVGSPASAKNLKIIILSADQSIEAKLYAPCLATARHHQGMAWTCGPDGLTITARQADGQLSTKFIPVKPAEPPAGSLTPGDTKAGVQQDDYDAWCELAGICSRLISRYVAETKGNLYYGYYDSRGIPVPVGNFDIVSRVNHNGTSQRFRTVLIWDAGPWVLPTTWYKECKEEVPLLPDVNCGRYEQRPVAFGPGAVRAQPPDVNGTPLQDNANYHEDTWGFFNAEGYPYTWSASPLRGVTWHCDTFIHRLRGRPLPRVLLPLANRLPIARERPRHRAWPFSLPAPREGWTR